MVDSTVVLFGQTLGYTLYAVAIILVVGWIGRRLTVAGKSKGVKPALFGKVIHIPGLYVQGAMDQSADNILYKDEIAGSLPFAFDRQRKTFE